MSDDFEKIEAAWSGLSGRGKLAVLATAGVLGVGILVYVNRERLPGGLADNGHVSTGVQWLIIAGIVAAVAGGAFLLAWILEGPRRRERRAALAEAARQEATDRTLEAQERDWVELWRTQGRVPPISFTRYYLSDFEADRDRSRLVLLRYHVDADEWVWHPGEQVQARRVVYTLGPQTLETIVRPAG